MLVSESVTYVCKIQQLIIYLKDILEWNGFNVDAYTDPLNALCHFKRIDMI